MEALSDIAPAHNPPYAKAMRQLRSAFPQIPLVPHGNGVPRDDPAENRAYAVPFEWQEQYEVQRWGFTERAIALLSTDR